MYCQQYKEAIHELADGTLGPVRRAELQTHLDQCDDCRALAVDMQKIRTAASGLGAVQPPDRAWLQIAAQLRQEGRITAHSQRHPRNLAVLAIAASLLLAVGTSLYLLSTFGRPDPADVAG